MVVLHPHDRKWVYISWITFCLGSIRFEGDTKKPWSLHIHVGEMLSLLIFVCLFVFRCYCFVVVVCLLFLPLLLRGNTRKDVWNATLGARGFSCAVSEAPRRTREKTSGTQCNEMPALVSMNGTIFLFCTNNLRVISSLLAHPHTVASTYGIDMSLLTCFRILITFF